LYFVPVLSKVVDERKGRWALFQMFL
jgi:hypothetical protein